MYLRERSFWLQGIGWIAGNKNWSQNTLRGLEICFLRSSKSSQDEDQIAPKAFFSLSLRKKDLIQPLSHPIALLNWKQVKSEVCWRSIPILGSNQISSFPSDNGISSLAEAEGREEEENFKILQIPGSSLGRETFQAGPSLLTISSLTGS